MSTENHLQLLSENLEATIAIGNFIGQNLDGGEVVLLSSDLGGGKTSLTRGIVQGAGSTDNVASPSFMICREYSAPKVHIFHYDFYRLDEPGIIENQIVENLNQNNAVVVVEWGDIVADVLPIEKITINISYLSDEHRQLDIFYSNKHSYLFEGIKESL